MSHLVWAAPALLNEDPHHLGVVVIGSHMYRESTIYFRQQWVGACLQKCEDRGEVALVAGVEESGGFRSVPGVDVCIVGEQQLDDYLMTEDCSNVERCGLDVTGSFWHTAGVPDSCPDICPDIYQV